ncbi:chloroplast sulfur E [Tasmannia lanceolata]|uniref:chloroplast sulfur E n=1 Tax=Tasmannia lanceolata TaxID=3420 RepID=UPI0040640F02
MSISSSFRLFSPKFPQSLHSSKPISKTPFPSFNPSKNPSFSSISLQKQPQPPSFSSPSPPSSISLQPIENLPPKLQNIIKLFQTVQNPRSKYEQLLYYGQNLPPLETQFKTSENKVEGCVSQVWVRAFLDSDSNVRFEADSDSVLTKGLAALLVEGLSGYPAPEIVRVSPDFVQLLGLRQSLTPSRNNGFLNMLKLMQRKALLLHLEAEGIDGLENIRVSGVEGSNSDAIPNGFLEIGNGIDNLNLNLNLKTRVSGVEGSNSDAIPNGFSGIGDGIENLNLDVKGSGEIKFGLDTNSGGEFKLNYGGDLVSRGQRIKEALEKELCPVELEVEDISHLHAGHAGVKGNNSGETHFNVRVVSKDFEGKSLVKRHRLVYDLLQEELQSGLHALSIVAKTPSEADAR